jgi:hypothetical protein
MVNILGNLKKGGFPMKLLPLSFTKDAARAVKRICKEAFTKVEDSVLTELLGVATLTVTMFCLRREGELEVLHYGALIVKMLLFVHDAERYVKMCMKKSNAVFATWTFGGRRLVSISIPSALCVSRAGSLLLRSCPLLKGFGDRP